MKTVLHIIGHTMRMLAAAACATLVVALLLAALGRDAWGVLTTMWEGAFGNRWRVYDGLGQACPLALCGLAVAVAFRGRALNIGAEGQYVCGAIAATAIGVYGGAWQPPVAMFGLLMASVAAGAIWALIAAALEVWRRVPLVLSTILMNLVAIGVLGWVLDGPLRGRDESAMQSDIIAPTVMLAPVREGTDFHAGCFLALAAAALIWGVVRGTTFGFALRTAGANPTAAEYAGVSVKRMTLAAMAISGALAGLAGGVQIAGVTHVLHVEASEGFGYVGIAVALLARLHPVGVLLAAWALALLDMGARQVAQNPMLGVPSDFALVIKGVLILSVLVFGSGRLLPWTQRRKAED